jgi:hypothetical protein
MRLSTATASSLQRVLESNSYSLWQTVDLRRIYEWSVIAQWHFGSELSSLKCNYTIDYINISVLINRPRCFLNRSRSVDCCVEILI